MENELDTSKLVGLLKVDPETLQNALAQAGLKLMPTDSAMPSMDSKEPETTEAGESMPTEAVAPGQSNAPAPGDVKTDLDMEGEGDDPFGGLGRTSGGIAHKLLKQRK